MLRVRDLDASLEFYVGLLGMRLLRRTDYPEGAFTLAFLGYGPEASTTVLELTHNWDGRTYELGSGFGHVAIAVDDVARACARLRAEGVRVTREPGPTRVGPPDRIAFVADPDGYTIELIERAA